MSKQKQTIRERNLDWRRQKVLELTAQGNNQPEISKIMQLSQQTISRDQAYLRQQAKDNIKRYIDERVPHEYEKCMIGLELILMQSWNIVNSTSDSRLKLQALSLIDSCINHKCDLLDNATVIDSAIKFVESRTKARIMLHANEQPEPSTKIISDLETKIIDSTVQTELDDSPSVTNSVF
ncbi:MAG TPA: helix-turn-helix domain-containing protein [Candidatus Nitrosopolaris sp.]